MYIKLSDQECF